MASPYRQRVTGADGRTINVVQRRAHLSYCDGACCCGLKRRLRNVVHLTKGGCLGHCSLANVASLDFDGRSIFFQSVTEEWQIRLIFDYIEMMIAADRFRPPPAELAVFRFEYYDWSVRPREASTIAPPAPINLNLLALLTHSGTDLITLDRARADLPAGLDVLGISLLSILSEDQMIAALNGRLAEAAVVILRIHGRIEAIPALELIRQRCKERGQQLVLVSGTGELDPTLARSSDVPLDLLPTVTNYLMCGGPWNMIECLKFLSDRLLFTGFGYQYPQVTPEHGIYLRDVEGAELEDGRRQADASRPVAVILFYRAHLLSGNTSFVDALAEALSERGLEPLCIFTASLKDERDGTPAAFRFFASQPSAVISTLSFAQGEANSGENTWAGSNISTLEKLDVSSLLILLTDGRANGALADGDPWEDALRSAEKLNCSSIVVDSSLDASSTRVDMLAAAMRGNAVHLDEMTEEELIRVVRP